MNSYKLFFIVIIIIFTSCNSTIKRTVKTTNNKNSEYLISNKTLQIKVKSLGAELSSIKHLSEEYLWQGDSLYWHEQAPILFPIVGKLKDNKYLFNGKEYKMRFHGFARKEKFKLIKKNKNSLTFQLKSNDLLKKQYPFDFELQIKYTLIKNNVNVTYTVKNLSSSQTMYFSIGAHPGFNYPKDTSQNHNDFKIVFDTTAKPKSFDKLGGLFNGEQTQYFNKESVLKLTDTTFKRGALVFKPNPFNKATLIHEPTEKAHLSITFTNFPYLGIWSSRKNAPFVCIEPWYGLADFSNHNLDITKKEGIQKLLANSSFSASYTIEILTN